MGGGALGILGMKKFSLQILHLIGYELLYTWTKEYGEICREKNQRSCDDGEQIDAF